MGRATARLFARHGISVCVADSNREGGEETAELVTAEGGNAYFIQTDLLEEQSVKDMVDGTVERFGAVHYLCNFAAQFDPRVGVVEAEAADFDRIVGVTLRGSWLAAKHAMRVMYQNDAADRHDLRGAVVLISSVLGHRGGGNYVAYTAAKSGVLGLLRAAAEDGGPHKVRVNCISPGITRTPATPMNSLEDELQAAEYGLLPFVAEPEDMAEAAVWLCSDQARFVNGAVLPVDGGWTAKL